MASEACIHLDNISLCDGSKTYTVQFERNGYPYEVDVYLSYSPNYASSDITIHGLQSKVTIPVGSETASFDIYVERHSVNSINTNIKVIYESPVILDPGCIKVDGSINISCQPCNVCDPGVPGIPDKPYREPGKDCCLFYDTVYERWRDYYPTCEGNPPPARYPDLTLRDGSQSTYDW